MRSHTSSIDDEVTSHHSDKVRYILYKFFCLSVRFAAQESHF